MNQPLLTITRSMRSVFIILLLVGVPSLHAERLPIKIYTSADGLGTSATFNLVRDSRGFIWICSRDGLIRFDGYRFITYRIGNDDADPAVYSLLPTRSSIYWVNLNRGTDYRFIDKGDATSLVPIQQQLSKNDPRVPLANVEPITDLRFPSFEDSQGNLWGYESRGLDLLREVGGRTVSQLVELNLPGNPGDGLKTATFKKGSDGSFWIGTNWGLVRRLENGRTVHYSIQPRDGLDPTYIFGEDKQQRIWMTRPEGILVLKVDSVSELNDSPNLDSRRAVIKKGEVGADGQAQLPTQPGEAFTFTFQDMFRRYVGQKSSDPTSGKWTAWGVLCASDGRVWIVNTGGLVLYDGSRFQHFTEKQGLSSNTISEIVEDGDGNIWLGSYAGLMRLDRKGVDTFDETDGLAKTRIHSIYEDRRGELTLVQDNWNISQLHNGVFKTVRPQIEQSAGYFWHSNVALLDHLGDWWVITSKKLYRYSGVGRFEDMDNRLPTETYTSKNGLIADETNSLFEDSHGDVWIGTDTNAKQQGLTRWQRSTGKFEHFYTSDGLPQIPALAAMTEDKAGGLWMGFYENGLARFRNGRFTTLTAAEGFPSTPIMNLFTDHLGRLWIATSQRGLWRVDDPTADRPVFRNYTIAEGLTSNNIRCLTEDSFGNIYLGTVRGVNRLSPDTGHVKYYGTGDGLAGDFVNVAHRDRDGALWFGTFSGLSKITPEPDVMTPPPPTLISGLRIAGIDYSISPLGQTAATVPEQSASSNNLQIDFFSISTSNSDLRYQYKLEGADQNWSQATSQRTVTLANLRPGRYRFLVRSINVDGVAFATPASIAFRILPPIWQRWWFITLAGLFIIGAIIALDRYRVARSRELSAALAVSQNLTDELTEKGSELSKAHRTLALDYEVTRILAESATPAEAAPRILAAICDSTHWEVGALWYVDDEAAVLRCSEVWYESEINAGEFEGLSRNTFLPIGIGLPGRVWESAEPSWINDLEKDANFPRLNAAIGVGLKSAFAFPILLGSEVIGVGEFYSREIRQRDEEMQQMLATIGSDIGQLIERKQSEEALRESEDRFRTLAETASDAIITIDQAGFIVFVNPAVAKVFGYRPTELLGQDLTMLMPEYLRHLHQAGFKRYQETGKKHTSWEAVEMTGLHQSGREIPLELSFGEFVRNERRYFTGIVRDVTDRKQAAEALQRSREERFRELEQVRRRIATDLHDDIGSSLTQISIMSEVAQNRAADRDNTQALSMIANSSRELVDAMSDIVWAINPQKDHLSDLKQRMRRFAADVLTSRNIDLAFRAPLAETDIVLGANIRREVFLIFKETVNNLVRHSAATRAEIDFNISDGDLVLRVSDNGKGFDANSESEGHGLMSLRERTTALSGVLEVTSEPGRGTTVTLSAPLDRHSNGRVAPT